MAEDNNKKIPCPVCENKAHLLAMDITPELAEEMAMAEDCPDFCGEETYRKRLSICSDCPELVGGMTCRDCGCFVQFRARHLTAHCVWNKW